VDISAFTHLRPWVKIDAGELSKLTAPKFRAMTSGGNYLEWTDAIECEDCWSYESFKIADGTATGTVNLSSIAYFEYQWTASTSVALGGILFDQLSATTDCIVSYAPFVTKKCGRTCSPSSILEYSVEPYIRFCGCSVVFV